MGAADRSLSWFVRPSSLVGALGWLVLAFMMFGCGGEETALPEQMAPPPQLAAVAPPPVPDSIYGDDGELLESELVVAGLRLPRGLEVVVEHDRRHVYRSAAPLTKMQSYFGVRLVTGQVDVRPGGGATYHDALPRDVRGGEVRLEVTLEASSASPTRLEIEELAPAPVTAPPEAETIQMMRERLRQAD